MRVPARSLAGAFALAVGIAALTVLTWLVLAFRGVAVGTLPGNAVTLQPRGVGYVAFHHPGGAAAGRAAPPRRARLRTRS